MTVSQIFFCATTKIDTSGGNNTASIAISGETKDISLTNILTAVYCWAGIIAIIVVVIAGFYYALSQDDPQRVARAKNTLLGAVVGLVIIFIAYTITIIVVEAF